jgi:hypothetical protein
MKRSFAFVSLILLVALSVGLSGCSAVMSTGSSQSIVGSGKLVTQSYDFTGFDSINAGSNYKLTVRQGEAFSVTVRADDNVMPLVRVEKSGDALRVDIKPGSYSFNRVTMEAEVTLPALKSLTADGNVTADLGTFNAPNLALHLKGNGIVKGKVEAGKLLVDGNGNGQARLSGATDDMTVKGQGNAILNLSDVTAVTAFVDIGSNAMVQVKVTGKLDYSVGGNAGLTYSGGAKLGKQQTAGNAWARGK